MKAVIQVGFIAFVLGFTPYAFYTLGHKVATYHIAQNCALHNTFIEHGNEFRCFDVDDYRGK